MATNTIKTRIQLKNDTEANWIKAINFIPKQGEVIIYLADDTHPFSRLKVGDGTTKVNDLPFIKTEGTVNKLEHKLTFGNGTYIFDGSSDVTVPTYNGEIL